MIPGERGQTGVVLVQDNSQSRNPPTVDARPAAGSGLVVLVGDQARDFASLVGHDMLLKGMSRRQVGRGILRGDAFLMICRQTGQLIAAAQWRRFGQQVRDIAECSRSEIRLSRCTAESPTGQDQLNADAWRYSRLFNRSAD